MGSVSKYDRDATERRTQEVVGSDEEESNSEEGNDEDDDEDHVKLLQPVNAAQQEIDEDFEKELAALTIQNPRGAPQNPLTDVQVITTPMNCMRMPLQLISSSLTIRTGRAVLSFRK